MLVPEVSETLAFALLAVTSWPMLRLEGVVDASANAKAVTLVKWSKLAGFDPKA